MLSAKAAIIQAELNLGYTTIAAPIGGIIGKIQVDPGNLVGKNEPTLLATISAVDPIYVEFPVAEADYLKLSVAGSSSMSRGAGRRRSAELELYLADDSLFPQKGRLIFVGRAFDAKTGTIPVQAEFPNPARKLRPGQFARVRGVVDSRPDAVLVPQLAVQEQQGAKIVLGGGSGGQGGVPARDPGRARGRPLHRDQGPQAGRTGHRRGDAEGAARHAGEGRAEVERGDRAGDATGGPAGEGACVATGQQDRRPEDSRVTVLHPPADRRDRHLDPDGDHGGCSRSAGSPSSNIPFSPRRPFA